MHMSEMRASFRFSNEEADFTALMQEPGSDMAAAVQELTGRENLPAATTHDLLHAFIEIAMPVIREKAQRVGYARLAEHLKTDPEHQAWVASRRNRPVYRSEEGAA